MNPGPAGSATSALFTLPGPTADRETVQGWARWRVTRHAFGPAPLLDLAQYRLLSPRARSLHDLHRAATHANLAFQETPMSAAVTRLLGARISANALKRQPTTRAGVLINGGGYQGKTETACEVAASFEDQWLDLHAHLNPDAVAGTRDLHAPVAYAQTPVTATPKSICEAVLGFYGADHAKMTLPQLVGQVRTALREHGTKVLILDDITRLKMHREADQDALDLLRSLMSMHVTLVLIGVGIPGSGLLREGRRDPRTGVLLNPPAARGKSYNDEAATQTERRFDLVHLDPFDYDTPEAITAWTAHLAGVEQQLRLFAQQPGTLTSGGMPEYLFRRTAGIVGLLERLLEDGCTDAIDSGTERLTIDQLDRLDINLGNLPHHTPVGERPTVLTRRRPARKGRNSVFDEHATPPSTAGDDAASA